MTASLISGGGLENLRQNSRSIIPGISAPMEEVTVYRWTLWSVEAGNYLKSTRWGTRDAISRLGGVLDEASGRTIDARYLNYQTGMTIKGFDPDDPLTLPR